MSKLKAIIVDDSLLYRMFIRNVLSQEDSIEVVSSAGDGEQALQEIEVHKPDLITLDIEMPILDGISVLRKLGEMNSPTQAIVLSGLSQTGAKLTQQALDLGAFDFVVKPDSPDRDRNYQLLTDGLTSRIQALQQSRFFAGGDESRRPINTNGSEWESSSVHPDKQVVVIGVSTGGPTALKEIVSRLPHDLSVPVLVVQHMPAMFTSALAQDLNRHCQLEVVEARSEQMKPGTIYIAPGGKQMEIFRSATGSFIRIVSEASDHDYRPSVDLLFDSAAEAYGASALGIVMTGMGDDGLKGCASLKAKGATVLTQDESTCVVYGMPRKVVEAKLSDDVVPLPCLADRIAAYTRAAYKRKGVPV